ncbi:MBL fold metallo-hydrolase [Bradyrhizobium neotropicale]|uniref:Metal-dependent hydrolase n=1 Tax=Bradyrhizobium neotropicale TaxID=1497615 RepID=A0A176YUN8_9BRAD|nr:MBL fold metallo-hydrolase [Bradyrhizobium neotropicale]OAF11373.1 metal-dependent hydrolase [Bradyrhizobium neotropicale]
MTRTALLLAAIVALIGSTAQSALSAGVKVTPLGSHDGEFCALDRALIFEDPDGTRILYDAGRTVRGPDDPRLGKIDGVLLSHVHGDHLGDIHSATANAGECGQPEFDVKDTPGSNTEKIVVAKKAKFFVGGEMNSWFGTRIPAAGGDKAQVVTLRFGAMNKLGGVSIWSVPAAHSNGVSPAFLTGDLAKEMQTNGLTAYVGPPGGYVLRFSNGLTVYLSGDTGVIADQDLVVRRGFQAKLAVLNIGDVFTTGPAQAAFVINELVQPTAVIASHANEAATKDGKLLPNTKTAAFKAAVHVPVYLPLSGKTMEFDADGKCTGGC